MAATAGGHEVAAGFLLQAGADPRISTNIKTPMFPKGVNAFHWAAAREDVSTFNQLLEGNLSLLPLEERIEVAVVVKGRTPLFCEILAQLLPKKPIPASALGSVYHVAEFGCAKAVSFILDECDKSYCGEELLLACLKNNHCGKEHIIVLHDHGGKIDITPANFRSSSVQNNRGLASLLIQYGQINMSDGLIDSMCRLVFSAQLFCQIEEANIKIPPFTRHQVLCTLSHGNAE